MKGIATLPTVLVIAILIIVLAVGVATISLSENAISAGENNSAQALVYAQAGARDALIKIARNKNFSCAAANCYSISFATNGCTTGNACALVSVSAANGSAGTPKIVTSTGEVGANQRKIQVSVIFDASLNGQLATTTWTELTN